MKKISSRAGSAILVVLGMTAFLLVSAIAFSAYMRYSRLPSSYLRRTSSTRQLAKAAMARAIDAVDVAVNNNPHPGVGNQTIVRHPYIGNAIRNSWANRVLIGTNATITADSPIDADTVSPLCLEALAYIPPPLVNEVRFFSRRTPTAHWHPLDFDAGRYAFCALDVSDYFDVNRILANEPRSSAPNRRVGFAYLFENDSHDALGGAASEWDKFMEDYRTIDEGTEELDFSSLMPLVSLADFNLALGWKGRGTGFKSPFYEYVSPNGENKQEFYGKGNPADKKYDRMTFVTDGLFPREDAVQNASSDGKGKDAVTRYDITDGANQPFTRECLENDQAVLSHLVMGKASVLPNDGKLKWQDRLSGLGCAVLYDYLDPNHVPVSLAIPTVERAPMICGVMPEFRSSKFAIKKSYKFEDAGKPKPNGDGDPACDGKIPRRTVHQEVYYNIDADMFGKGFANGDVQVLVCFPFAHPDENDGSFKLDGRFSLFFTEGDAYLRTMNESDLYHLRNKKIDNSALERGSGLINVKLQETKITVSDKKMTSEKDTLQLVSNPLGEGQVAFESLDSRGNEFLHVTYEWDQEAVLGAGTGGVGYGWNNPWEAVKNDFSKLRITDAKCAVPATVWENKSYKKVDPEMLAGGEKLAQFLQSGGEKELTLRAALWLRVKNGDGKIVDMVPACTADDGVQNDTDDVQELLEGLGLGSSYPLMLFQTGVSFKFSLAGLDELAEKSQDITLAPRTVMVADPRYNHAPEHWHASSAELSEQNWLDEKNQFVTQDNTRDRDLFMATSDAGYLQSPYEMAFLPRFADLVAGGDVLGYYQQPDGSRLSEFPATAKDARNSNLMWKTFDPIDVDADAFLNLPWTASGSGYKVNPFSDSTNILMSVFANTPIDWKRASTNEYRDCSECAADFKGKCADFNKKYAFNDYNPSAQFAWEDLEDIAGRFSRKARELGWDWQDALAELGDWSGTDLTRFCGVELDTSSKKLWCADRKFLYGFWSDCFAAKQQLFMVFVRAEPVMMGSGMAGQMPPQLGARAMALVWRDPRQSKDANAPHQTRVLFYRQFE